MTVRIEGEIDHHAAQTQLTELGRRIDAARPKLLTLDLGGVSFMDSSGIAVLVRSLRRMRELGGSMTVRNVPSQPLKVLKAAGIDKLIAFE